MTTYPGSRASCYPRSAMPHMDGMFVGHQDIQRMTGVTDAAVRAWLSRGRLPKWDGPMVNGQPTWLRGTILVWLLETRRDFLVGELLDEAREAKDKGFSWSLPTPAEVADADRAYQASLGDEMLDAS